MLDIHIRTVERLRSLGLAAMADTRRTRRTILRQPRCRTPIGSASSSIGKPPSETTAAFITPIDRRQAPSDGHHREHRLSYVTWSRSDLSFQTLCDLPMGT